MKTFSNIYGRLKGKNNMHPLQKLRLIYFTSVLGINSPSAPVSVGNQRSSRLKEEVLFLSIIICIFNTNVPFTSVRHYHSVKLWHVAFLK